MIVKCIKHGNRWEIWKSTVTTWDFPSVLIEVFFFRERNNTTQPESFTLGNNRNEIARTLEYRIKSSQFYEICKCLFVPTDAVFEIIKLPANGAVNFSLHLVVEQRITSFI